VVSHGDTGWLLGDDATAWHRALSQALDDAALRERIATRAAEVVRERHSVDQASAAWLSLLDELRAARRHAPARTGRLPWHARWRARWHDMAVAMRRANRERLARRRQGPSGSD
jgi:hypothetical protein